MNVKKRTFAMKDKKMTTKKARSNLYPNTFESKFLFPERKGAGVRRPGFDGYRADRQARQLPGGVGRGTACSNRETLLRVAHQVGRLGRIGRRSMVRAPEGRFRDGRAPHGVTLVREQGGAARAARD